MRSLILIFVYLSKDISKRWLETPGAVLARVSIAVSLCLLFLLMQAGFILAERAIEKKIESFGINSMILRTSASANGAFRPELSTLFEPLAEDGLYFPFSFLFFLGRAFERRKSEGRRVRRGCLAGFVRNDRRVRSIAKRRDSFGSRLSRVFDRAGAAQRQLFDSVVVYPPAVLRFVTLSKPVLFIPKSKIHAIGLRDMQESLFLPVGRTRKVGGSHRIHGSSS